MAACFYCKKELKSIEPMHLIRVRDAKLRGRQKWQTAAYCCVECEKSGKDCRFTKAEWQSLKSTMAEEKH